MKFILNALAAMAFALFAINSVARHIAGRDFDEAAVYQLIYGFEGLNLGAFFYTILGSLLLVVLALLILGFFLRFPFIRSAGRLVSLCLVLGLAALIYVNPVTQRIYAIAHSLLSTSERDAELFKAYYSAYASPAAISLNGRNLVVVYLESFERSFLDAERFPGLAPNLSALQREADNFTNIAGLNASGWTMGGMVASQCGIPLVTPINSGNDMNKAGAFLPAATCLGDYMKMAGYRMDYLGGAHRAFAGKDKFFLQHGFDAVQGLGELAVPDEPLSEWGRFDSNNFADVLKRYRALTAEQKPFGLFTLTLDTHAPAGYISPTCSEKTYQDGADSYFNALHCSDQVVGDFIRQLRNEPGFENTLLVVASDHLTMKNIENYALKPEDRHNLLFIFDGKTQSKRVFNTRGSSLDIAATIMDYLSEGKVTELALGRSLKDAQANNLFARFGSARSAKAQEAGQDVVTVDNKLVEWRQPLLQYWAFPTSLSPGVRASKDGHAINIAKTRMDMPVAMTTSNSDIDEFYLNDATRNFGQSISGGNEAVLFNKCNILARLGSFDAGSTEACYAAFSPQQGIVLGKLSRSRLSYSDIFDPDQGELLGDDAVGKIIFAAHEQTFPEFYHQVEALKKIDRSIKIVSTDWTTGVMPGVTTENARATDLSPYRGVNLIAIDQSGSSRWLRNLNFCDRDYLQDAGDNFIAVQQEFARNSPGQSLAIVVHDSAFCETREKFDAFFKGSQLRKTAEIAFRSPYIALVGRDMVAEYVGVPDLPLIVTNAEPSATLVTSVAH